MSLPAIEVTGVSKRYVIQHESRHDNLRDQLHHTARKLWRRFRWGTGFATEEFWALRDVSFSVQQGEVVGIIGRNGAGKSTLLKVLSRITEPTTGSVRLRGRVASLLEVGTGFHPDLTGRENIYLNGAILGMRRAEIQRKFDEIVAFAEIEKFLDTPVKRYSSGMYVRLAFAVAAHLEPEILIVDEVLAVGDANFQKKCLGKMQQVSRGEGRTVLFVSHNEIAVRNLCQNCILLKQGSVIARGLPEEVFDVYHRDRGLAAAQSDLVSHEGSGKVLLRSLSVQGTRTFSPAITSADKLVLLAETSGDAGTPFSVEVTIRDTKSTPLFFYSTHLPNKEPSPLYRCGQTVRIELELPGLATGDYSVSLQLVNPLVEVYSRYERAAEFNLTCLISGLNGWTFMQARGQGTVLLTGEARAVE